MGQINGLEIPPTPYKIYIFDQVFFLYTNFSLVLVPRVNLDLYYILT